MNKTDLKHRLTAALLLILLIPPSGFGAGREASDEDTKGPSAEIISKYVQATQDQEDVLRGASMEVNIDASIPKLKEQGRLRALRKISKVGQITYQLLGFQGDNTVKNQVIARYLQAEQQGQGDQSLAITPANYKFKYKGEKQRDNGQSAYVFQISPRKKKIGLFKGEIWLDTATYLPVFEKGRFVKNPSIFFKKVDFERAYKIEDDRAIPEYVMSTIDARLIGKVELNISYSNFSQQPDADVSGAGSNAAATPVAVAK